MTYSCVLIQHFYLASSRSYQLIHKAALILHTTSTYRVSSGRRKGAFGSPEKTMFSRKYWHCATYFLDEFACLYL